LSEIPVFCGWKSTAIDYLLLTIYDLFNGIYQRFHWSASAGFGDGQAELGEDFFHIFPDPSSIFLRIIAQQIGGVIGRHELYRGPADARIILVEPASQLAYRLRGVQQRPGGVSAQSNDNLGLDDFNLPLEKGQAAYNLFGAGVAIVRRAALQDVADEDIASPEPTGSDDFVQELTRPADKRTSLCVFIGAGSLSDEHNARVGIAFTGYGVRSRRAQAAFAALANFLCDLFKLGALLCDSHRFLLFLRLLRGSATFGSKAGENLLHFKMLTNNFIDIHLFWHRDRF
jgi:hypothetical protein